MAGPSFISWPPHSPLSQFADREIPGAQHLNIRSHSQATHCLFTLLFRPTPDVVQVGLNNTHSMTEKMAGYVMQGSCEA